MNRPVFFVALLAFMLAVSAPARAEDYGQAAVNPASLAEQDLAAQSRGNVAAALALYSDNAIVQYGGSAGPLVSAKLRSRRSSSAAQPLRTGGRSSANTSLATSRRFKPSCELALSRNPVWTESLYGAFTR